MDIDRYEGKWNDVKGKAKAKWAKLLDEDLATVEGKTDKLAGLIQKTYGYEKEKAHREAVRFIWDAQTDAWSNELKGHWKMAMGKMKERWGKLTDNEIKQAEGNSEMLLGAIQKEYGLTEKEAIKEFRTFLHDELKVKL